MTRGIARHDQLENADHQVVDIEVETREDFLGFRLLNTVRLLAQVLLPTGKAREIWVCMQYRGVLLRGIIDEVSLIKDATLISDTKTRQKPTEPSAAQKVSSGMQLKIYHWMVTQLQFGELDWQLLLKAYKCHANIPFQAEGLRPFGNLSQLLDIWQRSFRNLPRLCDEVQISYEVEGTEFSRSRIPVCYQTYHTSLDGLFDWWVGLRETEVADQHWKCRICGYLEECDQCPAEERPDWIHQRAADAAKEDRNEAVSEAPNATPASGEFSPSSYATTPSWQKRPAASAKARSKQCGVQSF